jgi:glyoxylase-like metal-dependent hydrolase (beta-lactamase superfamily II)
VHGTWREIADGVFVGRYRFYDQNIGAVVGSAGVLVIDTRSTPRQANEIREDLAGLTRLRVRWFVNTHWHYDHAFGNAVFRPAEGWGHRACPPGLLRHGEHMRRSLIAEQPTLAADLADLRIDPPERTFDGAAEIDIGGRLVELRHLGRGHTDADIVAIVPPTAVVFAGDLLENGAPPYFGDGYPLDWPAAVEGILERAAGPVVPGHGDIADRAFVATQLGDLRALADLARRAHADELTADDVLAAAPWDRGPLVREGLERAIDQLAGRLDDVPG